MAKAAVKKVTKKVARKTPKAVKPIPAEITDVRLPSVVRLGEMEYKVNYSANLDACDYHFDNETREILLREGLSIEVKQVLIAKIIFHIAIVAVIPDVGTSERVLGNVMWVIENLFDSKLKVP